MKRHEHLLVKLIEECAEVAQRASKALRFGLDEVQAGQALTNAERLADELMDLVVMADFLEQEGHLNFPGLNEGRDTLAEKRSRVEKWLAYSRECGTLE